MNDASEPRGTSNTGLTLMGFALGAVVGAGLALLLAPASGKRTRQRLASTARRWSTDAGHTIDEARDAMGHTIDEARDAMGHTIDQTRDAVTELGTDAKSALQAGKDAFRHDRAIRESRSEHRRSRAGDTAPDRDAVEHSNEEAAR